MSGNPPPGVLFGALGFVATLPRLLADVFGEFPLGLPELRQQSGDDGAGIVVDGDLGRMAQAQAMSVFERPQHTRVQQAGPQQAKLPSFRVQASTAGTAGLAGRRRIRTRGQRQRLLPGGGAAAEGLGAGTCG